MECVRQIPGLNLPESIIYFRMQEVAVAVIITDKGLLLCQRRKGARYELQWEFPGGKVEPGESAEECLHRELREELSIHAGSVENVRREVSHYDDGASYEVHYFFLSSFSGELQNNVFEAVRWVTADELRTYDILQGNAGIVEMLLAGPFGNPG